MVGVKACNDDHEIMMITTEGIIIQLRVEDISILGRITSGVKMINLDKGIKVAQVAKVRERDVYKRQTSCSRQTNRTVLR